MLILDGNIILDFLSDSNALTLNIKNRKEYRSIREREKFFTYPIHFEHF